jgi:hypothetical protein
MQQRNRASNDVSLGFGSGETRDYESVTYRLCAANVSKKKKTRTQLISSLPPSTRNTVPARWSDTGSKVACRETSIIVLHASCGGQDLCLRFKGPYSKTTSLQLPLLHGASSTHESRGCRRLYRFVCIQTTFRCLFHLTACACCWRDHFVGWSRRKANALSVFC